MKGKIIFVTGTDTGAGKTLLTALMLHKLRSAGLHALAMKPFCSGGRGDVRLLQALQPGELSEAEMNPFYFAKPVAPLAAERKGGAVRPNEAVQAIEKIAAKCEYLLVEGSGGLLVPLGRGFLVSDLIAALGCPVVVAARNRLGVINHTLLTVEMLRKIGVQNRDMTVVLMGSRNVDASCASNARLLRKLLRNIFLTEVEYLGSRAFTTSMVKRHSHRVGWVQKRMV